MVWDAIVSQFFFDLTIFKSFQNSLQTSLKIPQP